PVTADFYGVDFVNPDTGWVVGRPLTIIRTTNGGYSWTDQTPRGFGDLYDVGFFTESTGIVVGGWGDIFRTTSGGAVWDRVAGGTSQTLWKVTVVDSTRAWAVGWNGAIIHTVDAGLTWTPQTSGVSQYLWGVDFYDRNLGWACGDGPTLIQTTDGGTSWNSVRPPPGSGSLRDVSFVDSLRCWVADYAGLIFSTTDAGKTWVEAFRSPVRHPLLRCIKAADSGHLMAVGLSSAISSSDSGRTWASRISVLPTDLVRATRNIVATIPGVVTPEKECVVVGHYDSISDDPWVRAPGADDNASGTSAVMELARICREYEFESTIRFVALAAEEGSGAGSDHDATTAKTQGRDILGVVNGDMIAFQGTADPTRIVLSSYPELNALVDSAALYNQRYDIGGTLLLAADPYGASDHVSYTLAGYEAIMVIEATVDEIFSGSNPYWHTQSDTWDKLNPGLLRRSAQLMLATIAELARPVRQITGVADHPSSTIPQSYALSQNYPNPFNPTTTIEFALPQAGYVTLKVHNVLGEEVARLVDGEHPAGRFKAIWDASEFPSGLYFYRLIAGESIQTGKMMLLK
ncbi:MAG: M28 family peptidase, partial [Bacteroidota bacterium]